MSSESQYSGPRPCPECGQVGTWTGEVNGPGIRSIRHTACRNPECEMRRYVA